MPAKQIQQTPGQPRKEAALAYATDLWEFYEEGLRLAGLPE
jgi:hypothetical protein